MNTLCISERVEELEYSYTDGGNVKRYSYFSKQFIHFLTSNTYWASLIAQLEKNLPAMQEMLVQFLVRKICWRRDSLPTPGFFSFPPGSAAKESTCNVGDLDSIPWLGRFPSPEEGYHPSIMAWKIP